MGVYVTFGVSGRDNTNLLPLCTAISGTLSGGPNAGDLQVALVELPGAFAPEFDDLSPWMVPGVHVKLWQDEGGRIVFRYFGGLLLDATEIAGDPSTPAGRLWLARVQGYDGAALDATAVGQLSNGRPAFTIPAGTFAAQVHAAASRFNGGAALQIDWTSQVANLTGGHIYPALPVRSSTFRQVLRALLARAVAVNNLLVPRFRVDVGRGVSSDFGAPVLYVYDAAAAAAPALAFADVPSAGQYGLAGPTTRTATIRPPYATRSFVTNIGGAYATATSAHPGAIGNLLNPAGTWDTVVTNVANAAGELPGEAARLASKDGRAREELRWGSYDGRAYPGTWVRVYHRRLHGGYATGKATIVTDVQVDWEEKTLDATINGHAVGNPILLRYTGTDRVPELGDDSADGPDLSQVLASTPATSTRNVTTSPGPGTPQLVHTGPPPTPDADPVPTGGVDSAGNDYPERVLMEFRRDGSHRYVPKYPVTIYRSAVTYTPDPSGLVLTWLREDGTDISSEAITALSPLVAGYRYLTLAVAGLDPSTTLTVRFEGTSDEITGVYTRT